eukprot:gene29831-46897_t
MAQIVLGAPKPTTKDHPLSTDELCDELLTAFAAQWVEGGNRVKAATVYIFYIHMPATKIPLEDTLAEINQCYVDGKFEHFGLSNFPAWQVGVYNALNRTAERELVPAGVDRFAQKRRVKQYEERYLKRDEMFAALDAIDHAAAPFRA